MLPDIHRATQKFYIFLIVYLTGCTPEVILDTCQGFKQVRSKFYPRFIQADVKKPLKTRFFLDKLKCQKLKKQGLTKKVETL